MTVGYVDDEALPGALLVAAGSTDAAWAGNLLADPACHVRTGDRAFDALAEPLAAGRPRSGDPRPDPALRDTGRRPRPRTVVPAPAAGDRGPMTISVEIETRIGRPPADVFAALADVERYPEWLIASGIVRVERLDTGPLAAGSRLRIAQTVAGRSTVLDGSITVLAPGAAFGLRGKDREGVSVEIDAVMATDEQATRLRWSVRVGLPLRFRMFESMVAPQARRAAALDLEALKRRLEAAPG